jgi:hypothetical protein
MASAGRPDIVGGRAGSRLLWEVELFTALRERYTRGVLERIQVTRKTFKRCISARGGELKYWELFRAWYGTTAMIRQRA